MVKVRTHRKRKIPEVKLLQPVAPDPEDEKNKSKEDQVNEVDTTAQDFVESDQNTSTEEILIENPDPETIRNELSQFTSDLEVIDDFVERQGLNNGGRVLRDRLNDYNMESPIDSAGDIDAAWTDTNTAGEEAFGGTTATPDQSDVDDAGEAAGLTYEREEPLNSDKVNQRDRDRWELNPGSSLDAWFVKDEQEGFWEEEAEDEVAEDLDERDCE